jgi:hypothetical protein
MGCSWRNFKKMQFQSRSKEQAIADIASKVSHLPPNHPERPALLRMIKGLRSDRVQAELRKPLSTTG